MKTTEETPMKPQNLEVPAGKKVRISLEEPQGGRVTYLRPKTVQALKTIAGVPVQQPARLADARAFEILDRNPGERLAHLLPDRDGTIRGVPSDLVHAIITNLDERSPIPKRVRIVQRSRRRKEMRQKRSLFNMPSPYPQPYPDPDTDPPYPPDLEWVKRFGWYRKVFEALVGGWLQDLAVYSTSLTYGDVEIHTNGTLVVGEHITNLTANNFRMHQGAKVIQESPSLTADITGELLGDLP